jgi:hypothetical protein
MSEWVATMMGVSVEVRRCEVVRRSDHVRRGEAAEALEEKRR